MADILDIEQRISLALKIGESHYREFKSAFDGAPDSKRARNIKDIMTDVGRTLVGFSNADGGELIVGVEDDGSITGIPHNERALALLMRSDHSHVHAETPLPPTRKKSLQVDGKTVAYFSVSKGSQYIHLTSDGRCLRRLDADTMPYSAERIESDRLEGQSRMWDRETAPGATIEDLDLDLVKSVAAQIAYGISVEKCIQYLDLGEFTPEGMRLKRAAVMLFAKDIGRWHPGCFVRIMTIHGKEKRTGEAYNVKKDELAGGNILSLVDSSWSRLSHALGTHTQLTESARFQTSFMFPQIAVREALINAVIHRNYAIEGRGIEVTIYQDRMEILSPGMLLSTISVDDIRALKGVHESRNPLIARVLREVGLVREMGEGIRRIFDVMRSTALAEPEIESDTSGFRVTLFHKSLYDPNVKLWLSTFDQYKLPESQIAIVALGYGGKEFSTQEIIDRLGIVDIDHLQKNITPLRTIGLIERTKNHAQAYSYAKAHRIPKREVPTYRVVEPRAAKAFDPRAAKAFDKGYQQVDIDGDTDAIHHLFIAKIPYRCSKPDVVGWLSQFCIVRSLHLPPGEHAYGSNNKGFCFAEVAADCSTVDLISTLSRHELEGRRLRIDEQRQRDSASQ